MKITRNATNATANAPDVGAVWAVGFWECHQCGQIKDRRGVFYGDTVHLPRKTKEDYQTTAKAVARRLKHKKEVEQWNV